MRALFISAGGDHGAIALGMLHTMHEDYTHVCGISAGALIAAGVAHSKNTQECAQQMFKTLQHQSTAKPWTALTGPLGTVVNVIFAMVFRRSLFQSQLPKLAQPYLHKPLQKTLQVGAYNTTTATYHTFTQSDKDIDKAIIASASVPGLFTPVEIRGEEYVDGGVAHILPVNEILDYWQHKEGDIDILLCYPTNFHDFMQCEMKEGKSLRKDMEKYAHEIMWNTMQRDIATLERHIVKPLLSINRINERTVRFVKPTLSIYSNFIKPSKETITRMFKHGQDAARTELRF